MEVCADCGIMRSMEAPAPRAQGYWRVCERSREILDFSDEVLLLIVGYLDPFSLLRTGATCYTMHRICSTDSLWAKHCTVVFGSGFRSSDACDSPKKAFKLLFIWRKVYRSLPYNKYLQDLLFSGTTPKEYWLRWLTLEEVIPLPPIQLTDHEIEDIWGIGKDLLDEKHKVTDESLEETEKLVYKYEWKELNKLALGYHGSLINMQELVLQHVSGECHEELEGLFKQYMACRYQWLFSYWLFGLSRPVAKQLQKLYLWWKSYDKREVSNWGAANCNIQYIASLHPITVDYLNGILANGEEHVGIRNVENYFSMSRSLLAWILGRRWGRFKQKKVYTETLDEVYKLLKLELHVTLVTHEQFWTLAKILSSRICRLEETAGNYVNWKIIGALPCYRMYLTSGDPLHLYQIKGFLFRKRLINDWLLQEGNMWVRQLLPDCIYQLLEYETIIHEAELHGDTYVAYLSRLIWLYLHSGHQLYMEATKGFILEFAYASFKSQMLENGHIVPLLGFYQPF
ncbi:uncharacterized protein LOC134586302 [Pelobates fuscus]|uniref:uncharacterized protein LOC134586302 n=1 Tax=Pelobates fuscus TaxID=191477 RepID=UPI002FE4AA1D